jgi:putative spermidine/putrescine transport system substrate-binding protein
MSSAWSGRIYASAAARKEIQYTWIGAAHELDYWVIPRGSRNVELATEFIHFASTAQPMAKQAAATAYGPTNALAFSAIPKTVLPNLPTAPENWRVSFVVNANWWAANEQKIMQRWTIWRSKR